MPFIKYPILNDKSWLYTQYVELKRSAKNIAEELGCNCSLVRQACIKYGFLIRNQRQAQVVNSFDDFKVEKSVLYGTLLGDGFLGISNKNSSLAKAFFVKKNKYKEHIEYCGKFLITNFEEKISEDLHKLKGKEFKYFSIRSTSSEVCDEYYQKWYPLPSREKIIPEDIFIDEIVLLHWFLDDGYSHKRIRKDCKNSKKKQVIIGFCCESFSKEENQLLCKLINKKFKLNAKIFKCQKGKGWRINIPQSKSKEFFRIIGPPPVKALAYKWKWTEEELNEK